MERMCCNSQLILPGEVRSLCDIRTMIVAPCAKQNFNWAMFVSCSPHIRFVESNLLHLLPFASIIGRCYFEPVQGITKAATGSPLHNFPENWVEEYVCMFVYYIGGEGGGAFRLPRAAKF